MQYKIDLYPTGHFLIPPSLLRFYQASFAASFFHIRKPRSSRTRLWQFFVRGGKSDPRCARAPARQHNGPNLHTVPNKSTEQQDLQLLHRIRQRHIRSLTALANQIRGVACEYGVDFPARSALPLALEGAENELTCVARELLAQLFKQLLI